jgi:hypothetical protein
MPASATRRFLARPSTRSLRLALPWRQVLARVLLGLMLLAAQQGALLHALGHGFEALKHGSGQPAQQDHRDCCAAFHGLDHAVAAAPALPVSEQVMATRVAQIARETLPSLRLHFRSRAPPQFS